MRKIGIIGLAQVGKTTLFSVLTHAHGSGLDSAKAQAHLGVVRVPDARLDRLEETFRRGKAVHATLEYVDTPGSVIELARTGIPQGGTAPLREVDALAHVVRAFEEEVVPPAGAASPQRDVENVDLELILSDLAGAEKRLERLEKDLKKQKSPALEKEREVLQVAKATLEKQTPLREIALEAEDERLLRGFAFLSSKPMLYVLNLAERDAAQANAPEKLPWAQALLARPKSAVTAICGKVEAEMAELSDADAAEFLASYGLADSALERMTRASYKLLGLISFFTVGDNECRAWSVRAGATALEAAGEVHSDFQKGFIRAEVVGFEELAGAGSFAEARKKGLVKLEGKGYVLHDGEVVYFRHSS